MFRRYYYLLSLLLVFIIPSIIAGYVVLPYISINNLIIFAVVVTLVGSIYDLWATRHGRRDPIWLWTFNRKNTIGVRFLGLPIEEYLFYTATSIYVVLLWQSIEIATETGNELYYLLIPGLGMWTILSLAIPYALSSKRDKYIG